MPIDEKLRELLIKRGQKDRLKELEEAEKESGFGRNLIKASKELYIDVADSVATVGESVGGAIALGKIGKLQTQSSKDFEKAQEETLKREVQLNKIRLRQLKDPNISKEKKQKLAKMTYKNNLNMLESVPEANKSAKQIFAEGATTALNVWMGLSLVGKMAPTGVISQKLVNANKFINEAGKAAGVARSAKIGGSLLRATKYIGEGAAFGTALALKENKDIQEEVKKQAVYSLVPSILGRGLKLGFKTTNKIAKGVNESAEKLVEKLKEKSQSKIKSTGNFLMDSASVKASNIRQTLAGGVAKTLEKGTKELNTDWTDRLYAIDKFDEFSEAILGTKIKNTVRSAYIKFRNFAGVQGKFTVAKKEFDNLFDKKYKDIKDEVLGYAKGMDLVTRMDRGQVIEKGTKIEDVLAMLNNIERRVEKKGFDLTVLKQGLDDFNNFTRKHILKELVDSGLKSKEDVVNMLKANPNYFPHKVLDFFEKEAKNSIKGGGGFNVADNLIKASKGSERELAEVDIATLYQTQQVKILAERNRAMRHIVNIVKEDIEAFKNLYGFQALRKAEDVIKRNEILSNLKKLFKKNVEDLKKIKGLKGNEKKIDDIKSKKQTLAERDLKISATKTEREMNNLFNEAATMASEFESKTDIVKVLSRAETRERKLFKLNRDLEHATNKRMQMQVERIKPLDDINREIQVIKNKIQNNIAKRKDDINDLKNELNKVRDLEKKSVDYKKEGLEKVSYFNNGIREDWLVPEDIGRAIKNLDAKESGFLVKLLSIPASILRAGSTSKNIGFSLTNVPRDIQTAAGLSEHGLSKKVIWEALNELTDFNNKTTKEFFEGGGAFGGLISVEKPSRDILSASRRAPIFNLGTGLAQKLESFGEHFENSIRLAVYKQARKSGMSKELAIFEARNATVDFAKAGNVMNVINKVVPFLNARVQGLINMGKSFESDPTKFLRRQMIQAVYPAMYLYSHNNRYESFKNVSQRDKDNNWIIMYGESDGYDRGGSPIKVPEYIKIRKGEVQAPLSNMVENYFDMSNRKDPRSVSEFFKDQLGAASPIGASSLGPLTTPFEMLANYDLFTKLPIEPEYQEVVKGGKKSPRKEVPTELRKNRWTGQTAIKLSEGGLNKLGISPAEVEFIVGKITGTVGKDLLRIADMTQSGVDQTGLPEGDANITQILSSFPIIKSYIGSNASAEKIMLYKIVEDIDKERFEQIEMPREMQAATILDQAKEIKKKQGIDEANKFLSGLDLDKDMTRRLERINENLKKGQTIQKQIYDRISGNEKKAEYIIRVTNMIPKLEDKNKFLKDMKISKDIAKILKFAQEQGKFEKTE